MSSSTSEPSIDQLISAFAATLPFALDEFQREAIERFERLSGVLVSAPTSSGKTVIAEYAIWRCLEAADGLEAPASRPRRVIYTTPLKALSNQKFHDLVARYGERSVGLITGEHTVNDSAEVIVMTTEILRNVIYDEPERIDTVGTVVLDEIHYINDFPRGTVWEEVIIEAPRHIRFIGLSATISNVEEVAAWMSELRGEIATVLRTERPVPLEMWLGVSNTLLPLFDSDGGVARSTLDAVVNEDAHLDRFRYSRRTPENDLLRVVETLRQRRLLPAIYFIFSRKGCREALSRCALHSIDLTTDHEKQVIDEHYGNRIAALDDSDERAIFRDAIDIATLRRGTAMHHAGMLPYAKETVEDLFKQGLIKVVFATETLSLGLNMPARACVVSSFTKFDGVEFSPLNSAELTQLLGRAGRRGIDTVGHGILLKESDVDIHDIYEAALGGDMPVISKFAPTYSMTLTLLRTRTLEESEALLERSFGQYQALHSADTWDERQALMRDRLDDLRRRVFRHPTVRCSERTLSHFLHAERSTLEQQDQLRKLKREGWQAARHGQHGGRRLADPGGRMERVQRELHKSFSELNGSPCRHCSLLPEHRAQRSEITDLEALLSHSSVELEMAKDRYRREFRALRAVLTTAGFLHSDEPTEMGLLAERLYGESSLIIADGLVAGIFDHLAAAELAATLVMLVAEDRGRGRDVAQSNRDRFPSVRVERAGRAVRAIRHRLVDLEAEHGLETMPRLSYDYLRPAFQWASGAPLTDIEPPGGAELGDVVKAMKSLYSLLRQMELALRLHRLLPVIAAARQAMERDLIRRV